MEILDVFIELILHMDVYLADLASAYGAWIYAVLFLIVFCETGLVVTPFLPGDSLLFAAGALAAVGAMSVQWLVVVLIVAAVAGDSVNYTVGRWFGLRLLHIRNRFLNQRHLERTTGFYETHGGKTIVLARFIPIVRTYAPFVAGIGRMNYKRFLLYNVAGGIVWVTLFVGVGYFFGNVPIVKENMALFVLGIIAVSVLPLIVRWAARISATRTHEERQTHQADRFFSGDAGARD